MKVGISRVVGSVAAVAVVTGLSACGGSSGSGGSSDQAVVTVWMYPVIADEKAATTYWTQIEKDFEAANAGIDLRIEQQPWANRDQKLATAFSGGKGPDVLLLGPDQIPQFVTSGSLEPVDKVLEADKDKFLPGALDALKVDGKLYAVPIYHTVTTTVYNKKLLAKAGITKPPETWDEIKAAVPKFKQAGVATLDYSASPEASLNLSFYPLLWQAGGKVFTDDGKSVAFNQAPGVEALTFLKDLYDAGGIPKSALSNANVVADQALGKQQVAMGFTNTLIDAKTVAASWGAANVVVGAPLENKKRVGFGLPGGLAVNAGSKDVDAAEKFLGFMTQPKQEISLATASNFLSPRTDAPVPAADEQAKKFEEALQYAYSGEVNPAARQVMTLLSVEIQAVLTGKKTPQEALDAAAKQSNDLLSRQR